MFSTGETVGLAEWIIDDACFGFKKKFFSSIQNEENMAMMIHATNLKQI